MTSMRRERRLAEIADQGHLDSFDVVIVGGGFGGAYAARVLERGSTGDKMRVLLVSTENFLSFSPLLPEVASGTLEARHAVIPLREMLRATHIVIGAAEDIDLVDHRVSITTVAGNTLDVGYRALVLAPGSVPNTYDVPGLQDEAVGFKTLGDALWLRNHIVRQLESAEASTDPEQRRPLLTFTFVGGGYAGVEGLAETEAFAVRASRRYPHIDPATMRWVLVEAAPTLLPGLDYRLADYTLRHLRERGVEVHLNTRMLACEKGRVVLTDDSVEPYLSGTIVWATGQRPNRLATRAGLPTDARGRVLVDECLRVVDHSGIYAIGDGSAVPDPAGGICPPTAQHARRQGVLCARNVTAELHGGGPRPFNYRNRGLAVTLGNHRGVARVRGTTLTGTAAWWLGRSYHLLSMPGVARRSRVVSDWTIALLFPKDVADVATGSPKPPLPPPLATPAPST